MPRQFKDNLRTGTKLPKRGKKENRHQIAQKGKKENRHQIAQKGKKENRHQITQKEDFYGEKESTIYIKYRWASK